MMNKLQEKYSIQECLPVDKHGPTCESWGTRTPERSNQVAACCSIFTGTGSALVDFRTASLPSVSDCACARIVSGSNRKRVTSGTVEARSRLTLVCFHFTPTSGIERGAFTPERVNEVNASSPIETRRRGAFVDIPLTTIPAVAIWTLAIKERHLSVGTVNRTNEHSRCVHLCDVSRDSVEF